MGPRFIEANYVNRAPCGITRDRIRNMTERPSFWSFTLAFRRELFAAMSGGASVPFVIAAVYVDNKYGQAVLALCALTCAWFAAFRLWRPERQKVCDYEDRLSTKIDVFLDRDCSGVRIVETRIDHPPPAPQTRGPDSKWVQIMVTPATHAPLANCEARLIRVERVNDDGTVTAILTEPVYCVWSNSLPTERTRMTIPPSVPQAANIFSARDGFKELYMETSPIKYEFRDQIQRPGKYRLKVGASAQACQTNVKTFRFEWGGSYDRLSITEE